MEKFFSACWRQRVEPELRVVGLAAPAVLVLRAVVHDQQDAGRRQTVDQAVEQGLRLSVEPVQVFKDQQQGLHLAFAQQHALERGEGPLPSLRRIERQERAVGGQRLQECQQCRDGLLQRLIQGQEVPRHFGPHGAWLVSVLDVHIVLEQLHDWQIGGGFAVRHRGGFQHQPALRAVGGDELVQQAGLAHPGLSHRSHDLTVPRTGRCQRLRQRRDLGLPADKAGEAARHCRLQGAAQRTGADQFKHLHGLRDALDRDRTQGSDPHQALDQPQDAGGQSDTARAGQLLHARRQMRRLPHGGVVHVQVVADRPHHHFSRVEAHPDAQLQAVGAAHLLGIRAHRGLHGQGGVTGAQGVVLMGDGGAKQGHDAIAEYLVRGALIAVHGIHHVAQGRVQELLGSLGVAIPDQLGGVFDVSEQHRDLLAFAFQGTARGEDLLGQIGRRVGQWCRLGWRR